MYDNHTPDQLREALALCDQQRATAVDLLDSVRSELRLEKQRVVDLIREKTAVEVTAEDRLREVNRLRAEAQLLRTNWASDVREISAAFRQEAIDRGWCEEADQFIRDLNRTLHAELAPPRRTYDVAVQVLVSVPVTVEAIDEDDARQIANNEWRNLWTDRDYNAREVVEEGDTQEADTFQVEVVD